MTGPRNMGPIGRRCSIDGCEKKHHALGFCSMHYCRQKKHGDPLGGRKRYATPAEAFEARTEWSDGCLIWTGATAGNGYGALDVEGAVRYAHRFAWERIEGPIPDGLYIDHLCHNPPCVNTDHLRLATPQENSSHKRGAEVGSRSGIRGVYWNERSQKWQARAKVGGQLHIAGLYPTKSEAEAAVIELRRRVLPFAGD